MNRVRRWWGNLRLKSKFMLIFCSLLLTSSITVVSLAFLAFYQYDRELYQNTSQLLNTCIDTLESDLTTIDQIGVWSVSNDAVQDMLNDSRLDFSSREPVFLFGRKYREVHEALSYQYNRTSYVISAAIYVDGERLGVGQYSGETGEELQQISEAARKAEGRAVWLPSGKEDSSLIYAREIRDLQTMTFRSFGVLIVRVDLREIVADRITVGMNLNYHPQVTILNENGELLFTDLPEEARLEEKDFPPENSYRQAKLGGRDYFVSYATHSNYGLRYALYVPFDSIAFTLRTMNTLVLLVSVLIVAVCMILCSRIVEQIVQQLHMLMTKIQLFQNGDFQELSHWASDRRDELGDLNRSFDEMSVKFQRLVEDNYVKQLSIKDMRLKSLQNQLNPHFLFNISRITEALGKILRYTLREQELLVPLEKELEITRSYISIQQYRYADRLIVCVDVPERWKAAPIPPMCLQNLVENAIKHAMENMLEPCTITIGTKQQGEDLLLFVEDNGPGIDEDALPKAAEQGGGVGLTNIRQRVQLLLGEPYGLKLYNTGTGTRAELLLPGGLERARSK